MKLNCLLFGHNYVLESKILDGGLYRCLNCKKLVSMVNMLNDGNAVGIPIGTEHKMTSDEVDFMREYDFNNCGCDECKKEER